MLAVVAAGAMWPVLLATIHGFAAVEPRLVLRLAALLALVAQASSAAQKDALRPPTPVVLSGTQTPTRGWEGPPAGTPPGDYRVIVGLYDERGRLKLNDGRDQFELFDVTLTP